MPSAGTMHRDMHLIKGPLWTSLIKRYGVWPTRLGLCNAMSMSWLSKKLFFFWNTHLEWTLRSTQHSFTTWTCKSGAGKQPNSAQLMCSNLSVRTSEFTSFPVIEKRIKRWRNMSRRYVSKVLTEQTSTAYTLELSWEILIIF